MSAKTIFEQYGFEVLIRPTSWLRPAREKAGFTAIKSRGVARVECGTHRLAQGLS
jgi:hypothetical protein